VFLDTKKVLGEWASKARFIKINDFEYKNSKDKISESLNGKIIHTVGERGCNFQGENFPVTRHEIRDTSGAGDSFMAALVVEFLKTQDIFASIKSANVAASQVVQHRGVGVI
jgi:sugar/nucleoside kinase (ribokinase family)